MSVFYKSIKNASLFSMMAFLGCASVDESLHDPEVLVVNGEAVTQDEFCWFMRQERASVFGAVNATGRLDSGETFWTQDYDGISPKEMLYRKTIEKVIREKVQQDLFRELDLAQDIRFCTFMKNLEKLNQERKQIVEQKGVIYGPIQYSPLQYYGHWMATMQTQAKAALRKERFDMTESNIQDYYRRNKNRFMTSESFTLETLVIRSKQSTGPQNRRNTLESIVDEIVLKIQQGKTLESISLEYADRRDFVALFRRDEQIREDRLAELFPDNGHFKQIQVLMPGQFVRQISSENEIRIIQSISKTPSDGLPYEQIRNLLADRYVDAEYDRLIEARIKNAHITINRKAIDRINIP